MCVCACINVHTNTHMEFYEIRCKLHLALPHVRTPVNQYEWFCDNGGINLEHYLAESMLEYRILESRMFSPYRPFKIADTQTMATCWNVMQICFIMPNWFARCQQHSNKPPQYHSYETFLYMLWMWVLTFSVCVCRMYADRHCIGEYSQEMGNYHYRT